MSRRGVRLPHPVILLVAGVAVCAALTWILPPGEYDRRDDPATGRSVVVAGTYHRVDPAPVGPFAAVVAIPRAFLEAADVIGLVLFVGGAWTVIDRVGTLGRLVSSIVVAFGSRGLLAIPVVSLFFAVMGALENMQEEIIPLVPTLLVLGRGLGVNATAVMAMSVGAAAIGSAFGPTNAFQAGIAMKLAQLPPMSAAPLKWTTFVAGLALWVAWTMWWAARNPERDSGPGSSRAESRGLPRAESGGQTCCGRSWPRRGVSSRRAGRRSRWPRSSGGPRWQRRAARASRPSSACRIAST